MLVILGGAAGGSSAYCSAMLAAGLGASAVLLACSSAEAQGSPHAMRRTTSRSVSAISSRGVQLPTRASCAAMGQGGGQQRVSTLLEGCP